MRKALEVDLIDMVEDRHHGFCLGYFDKDKHEAMTEGEQHAMFDTCFEYFIVLLLWVVASSTAVADFSVTVSSNEAQHILI